MKEKYCIWMKAIILGLFIFTLMYLGSWAYVSTHEETHAIVFDHYGMESEIDINYLTLSGTTTSYDVEKCDDLCIFGSYLVDIVGYHIAVLILNVWLIFFAWIVITEVRRQHIL